MIKVHKRVTIDAPIKEVFELIAAPERYSAHLKAIRDIKALPGRERSYSWHAEVMGVPLTWEADIGPYEPPNRYCWTSTKGFKNSGSYRLDTLPGGSTLVNFDMECHLSSSLADNLIAPIAGPLVGPLMEKMATEVLYSVKEMLEGKG